MCETREDVLKFICRYKRLHDGVAPTYREIMEAVGITSTSVVKYHLSLLEMEGRIVQGDGSARAIEVVGGQWCPPSAGTLAGAETRLAPRSARLGTGERSICGWE
jgi:SOS-response transcriptional repressor LexA